MIKTRVTISRWVQKSGESSTHTAPTTTTSGRLSETRGEQIQIGRTLAGKTQSGGSLDLSGVNRKLRGNTRPGDFGESFSDKPARKG